MIVVAEASCMVMLAALKVLLLYAEHKQVTM
jgi:hypothetical protein